MVKPLDYVTLVLAAGLVAAISAAVYGGAAERTTVRITAPSAEYLFASTAEERVTVRGPLGETVIEVGGGGARVLSSPGIRQICVRAGHVSRSGAWLACLPNRVFVSIESAREAAIDARSY